MAGTHVRSFGRSFVAAMALPHDWQHRGRVLAERKLEADTILLSIVVVQLLASALLIARNSLDLPVAACLSAGLVAAAALYASRRIGGAAATARPDTTAEIAAAAPPAHLEQVRASEAWADLMARISHEIRTPLNAVIGFSDLMEREIFGPLGNARYGDYAAHIRDSGEALLKSAEDTLALSSLLTAPQTAEEYPSRFELSDLLREAWRPIETQAARRCISLVIPDCGPLEVIGERRLCRQAFLNLLTEALNRTPDHSRIEIAMAAESDTVRLLIRTAIGPQWRHQSTPSLAACLARTFLERAGIRLVTLEDASAQTWQAATTLERPAQEDFFTTGL